MLIVQYPRDCKGGRVGKFRISKLGLYSDSNRASIGEGGAYEENGGRCRVVVSGLFATPLWNGTVTGMSWSDVISLFSDSVFANGGTMKSSTRILGIDFDVTFFFNEDGLNGVHLKHMDHTLCILLKSFG